jgi:hypothetical protein
VLAEFARPGVNRTVRDSSAGVGKRSVDDNPALLERPLRPNLLRPAACARRVAQFDAIRVKNAEHRRRSQEGGKVHLWNTTNVSIEK